MRDLKSEMLAAIFSTFPGKEESLSITRKELIEIELINVNFKRSWFMSNVISRGIYALPGHSDSNSTPTPTPIYKEEVMKKNDSISLCVQTPCVDFVPNKDPNYVPFGIYSDVEKIIKSKIFYPTYVYGPSGNGKSTTIEQVCASLNREMIRINLNSASDEDQLIGTKTLINGNVEIIEGPVVKCLREGKILLIDELDCGSANSLMCLQQILEGKDFFFKLKNEIIKPAPGFNVFATANTKGKGSDDGRYVGTNILNEAFLERFAVTMVQDYPGQSVEFKILHNLMIQYDCVDEIFAKDLVKWADTIRKTFDSGAIDENITTRRLTHIIRSYSIFKNKKKSIELCVNRFDELSRLSFLDLYDKIINEPDEVESTESVAI